MALILASTSPIRRQMLDAAGVAYRPAKPAADEDEIKKDFSGDDASLAGALAEAKALSITATRTGDWVIGSDSLISVDGKRFDKPSGRDQAANHLRDFSGREMVLSSAAALVRDGAVEWRHTQSATLVVRRLSEAFIQSYLDAEWPDVGYCVGVFRMEGRGVQLFDTIDGDHFTILGMPLLPLLSALRERGIILA